MVAPVFQLRPYLRYFTANSLVGWGGVRPLKGQFYEIWGFFMDIHRKSIVSRFLKFLCRVVVIELFNLKDLMRLMQKTYLFPVQVGMPLANASKICRIYGYSTLPDYWQCGKSTVNEYW